MTREHDKKIMAMGWQGNSHGNILLFMEGVINRFCFINLIDLFWKDKKIFYL